MSGPTCRTCGHRVHYVARRFAWVHTTPPQDDHGPRPDSLDTGRPPGDHHRQAGGGMTAAGAISTEWGRPNHHAVGKDTPNDSTEGTRE